MDKFKVEIPQVKDIVEDFYKSIEGIPLDKVDWSMFYEGCDFADESFIKFISDTDVADRTLENYKQSLANASSATAKFGATLKTIGANFAIMAGITLTIKAVSAAWDYFNVTVEETKEKIDSINSKMSELKSEIEQLDSVQFKTAQQEIRLAYLERELELQEKILEIELRRQHEELTGNKFTDSFDPDNLYTKYYKEVSPNTNRETVYELAKYSHDYNAQELIKLNEKINEASANGNEDQLVKLTEKRTKLLDEQANIMSTLSEKESDFYANYLQAQQAVDSGLLSGEKLRNAEELASLWKALYEEAKSYSVESQKLLGAYSYEKEIEGILSKADFDGIEEQLSSLASDNLLSEEVVNEKFPKLIEYLQQAGIDAKSLVGYFMQLNNPDAINYEDAKNKLLEATGVNALMTSGDTKQANNITKQLENAGMFSERALEAFLVLSVDKDTSEWEIKDYIHNIQEWMDENPLEVSTETPESPKWSFTETIKQMETAKEKLSTLDEAYAKLFDADANTNIGTDDFNSILDAFSDIEGLDIEKHLKSLEDAGGDADKVKASMEGLIGEYLYYGDILNNVTEENKDLVQTMLQEMGVINAEEIALAALNGELENLSIQKQFLDEVTQVLTANTLGEIEALMSEMDVSDEAKQALAQLALEKINVNNATIDTSADIANIIALAKTAEASTVAIAKLTRAKEIISQVEQAGSLNRARYKNSKFGEYDDYTKEYYDAINLMKQLESGEFDFGYEKVDPSLYRPEIERPNLPVEYDPSQSPLTSTSKAMNDAAKSMKDASETMKEAFEETVDFFEHRAKVLNNALELLKANLENVNGSFAKNKLIDSQIGINSEKINNYTDAMAMYTQKANEALSKLPTDIAQKIQNGSVSLIDFIGDGNEDVVEAVKEYQNWADKISDCKQEIAELKQAIEDLELEKFNNIVEDFQNMFDIREDKKGLMEKQIALLKEGGELIGESFYTAQKEQTEKQLVSLKQEQAKLVEQMNSALASGRVTVGSEAWVEMVSDLNNVEGQIIDCKTAIEEFDNAILALHTEIFNRIQEQFSNLHSELSNMEGLFDDADVSDGYGNWTEEAITRLGILAQQYELSKHSVAQYNEEIEKLNQDYLDGRYSVIEYTDRLAELTHQQWESVESANAASDAIYKLNEIRINEEIETINEAIDAYRELTDAKIEELRAEQELFQWKEKVADANKSITDLERQIAAMSNDTSASTVAKRKQLEAQLAEERANLEREQYDHSIDEQEKALNEQFEQYESERLAEIEALEESLEQKELLISQSFETVKQNAQMIGEEITQMADRHGIEMSESLTSAWKSGEKAIASYGVLLTAESSNFIANLINVEAQTWQLQEQANVTANSLAWMFATRADNLVAQLQASYTNEANLAQMTMALRDSLINTLERGYNISSITSALDTIAKSAENATSKIKQMNTEMGNKTTSNTEKRNWRLVDGMTGKVLKSGMTKSEAEVAVKTILPMGGMGYIETYAKGGIVTKDDKNPLNHIAKAVGEDSLIAAKEGEGVFTAEQTKLLQGFMNNLENPKPWTVVDAMKNPNKNNNYYSATEPMRTLSDVKAESPQVADKNMNNNVNMNYGSLITVNGDVNDTKHFLGQMENICVAVVNKSWQDATRSMKYGF